VIPGDNRWVLIPIDAFPWLFVFKLRVRVLYENEDYITNPL
jgi:hypothetical protein